MLLNPKELSVSKIEMAQIQLNAAIIAYFDGRCIEAITLAGAAEEIFGAMLRRDGKENSLEQIASLPQMSILSNNINKRIDFLNDVRNNLKHADDKHKDNFVITELDPFIMIVRALGNAALLGVSDSIEMIKFRATYTPKA